MTAEERIIKFLSDHPDGVLYVTTWTTSVWGLAWLRRHSQNYRKVKLLVGRHVYCGFGFPNEHSDALKLVEDTENTVKTWTDGESSGSGSHMKTWLVWDSSGEHHILTGSANLTKKGFGMHQEQMVEAYGEDLDAAFAATQKVFEEGESCKGDVGWHLREREDLDLHPGMDAVPDGSSNGATPDTVSSVSEAVVGSDNGTCPPPEPSPPAVASAVQPATPAQTGRAPQPNPLDAFSVFTLNAALKAVKWWDRLAKPPPRKKRR